MLGWALVFSPPLTLTPPSWPLMARERHAPAFGLSRVASYERAVVSGR